MRSVAAIVLGLGLAAGSTVMPAKAQAQAGPSIGDVIARGDFGRLDEVCLQPAQKAHCKFTPGQSRSYVVDILSADCRAASFRVKGLPSSLVKPAQHRLGEGECRIGSVKVLLQKGQVVPFSAQAFAEGRALVIWFDVRER